MLTLGIGLIGGWLTALTGGIAAAFLGHAITRFAVFLCTGHTGQTKPRGREVEEIEKRRRPPEGWRVIGSRESARATVTASTAVATRAAGRALRPRPVLRLALPVLRLRGLRGRGGARAASTGRGVPRGPARSSSTCGPTRSTRRSARSRPPLETVYLGGGTPSLLPGAMRSRALLDRVRDAVRARADAEVTLEANPGPDERGDAAALRAAGVTPLSLGAQSMADAELARLGRRHRAADVAEAVAAAREAGIRSVSLDLLYDVPDARPTRWIATLDAALALEPDHLSLYALTLDDPDAEGLTGPTGDHLPTTAGRPSLARARPAAARTRTAPPPSTTTRSIAWPTAGWRGYEISNWARPGHESRHNLVYWERRPYEAVGPGAHAFDGVDAALERGPPRRLPRRAHAGRRRAAAPPAGRLRSDRSRTRRRPKPSSSACGRTAASRWRRPRAAARRRLRLGARRRTSSTSPTTTGVVLTTRGRLLSNELFAARVGRPRSEQP